MDGEKDIFRIRRGTRLRNTTQGVGGCSGISFECKKVDLRTGESDNVDSLVWSVKRWF